MNPVVFKFRQFFAGAKNKRILSLIVILLIIAAVPLTVFISQKQQEIRQRASEGVPGYPISVPVLSLRYFPTVPCYNPVQTINLSGAVASSNSQPMNSSTTPDKAIDGNIPSSKWQPRSPFTDIYLLVDLGSVQSFKALSFYFYAVDRPESYHVDISETGSFSGEETKIITEVNGLTGYSSYKPNDAIQRKNYVFNQINARYIKFTIDKFRNNASSPYEQVNFYELEVYQNAEEKKCLDNDFLGGEFAARSTPDMTDPLSEIRNRVTSHNQGIIASRNDGSKYHVYKDSTALPSLNYSIFEDQEFLTKIPVSATFLLRPDYMGILNTLNICDYVNNRGVKEVWVWSYHNSQSAPEESDMAMGRISQRLWNMYQPIPARKRQVLVNASWGDLSNSWQENDLPVCNKTYTLYNFTYAPNYSNAMHDYIHQIENLMEYMDREMFWDMYVGRQYVFQGPRRCGHSHTPPNSSSGYDYDKLNYESTDCENWKPVNCLDKTPDCGGIRTSINCTRWNCNPVGYYVWWMQNIPGKENGLIYNGKSLRNWWDFVGDFDNAIAAGKSLTYETASSPTITPTPTIVNTPTPTTLTLTPTPTPTPTCTPKPKNQGNANDDCLINLLDFNIWLQTFDSTTDLKADFDNDRKVTILDFNIWRDHAF